MVKPSGRAAIRLRGVRHNNLKNFDLDLPLNHLVVITGLSGSGKSSLAFDTLFAEGQRRYIETFSPYARQFLDRMDKPQVDSIEGIPPAIAIEQRNSVRTTRSTVGTMTEICDYMKVLWPHIARLHCRQCGQPVQKDSPQQIWASLTGLPRSTSSGTPSAADPPEALISFDLPLTEKLSLTDSLALVSKQGYQRLLLNGQVVRLDELTSAPSGKPRLLTALTVIQDRLKLIGQNRPRFVEACEQAYHFGKGKLSVWELKESQPSQPRPFSNRLHCARCDIEYREPSPALFSFNHPVGACPSCRGFGRMISIDYNRALPDWTKTLAQGVVKPWQTGHGLESQDDLMRACRELEIPTNVPFNRLAQKWQKFVIDGDPHYGTDEEHQWPRAWYGVKGYFRWLESKAYKMHVRVLLSRYRAYTRCPACQGQRFQPEALLYRASLGQTPADGDSRQPQAEPTATLADFYRRPIRDAGRWIQSLHQELHLASNDPLATALNEVSARLSYLNEVGLGYLSLDRPTRSLSGGETERVNLTTCLGTRLVNTLFVLDEPSVGLHPRDTQRLVTILQRLRNAGNTVVIVEHEASVMRAADQIVDLGPGHGATGGQIVFQGSFPEILASPVSLTGQYLSGRKEVPVPRRRTTRGRLAPSSSRAGGETILKVDFALNETLSPYRTVQTSLPSEDALPVLKLRQVTCHNLQDFSVDIPLQRLVCITGVSGSGKTTLLREVLLPALASQLKSDAPNPKASDRLDSDKNDKNDESESESGENQGALVEGSEHLDRVILVDQSILAKTPRSNPAVYIGAFDDIREVFAQSEIARQRGLNASSFSFNSPQGQCERCRGAGYEKIEMQFLSDVFIRCPDCDGRRYRAHILEVRIRPPSGAQASGTANGSTGNRLRPMPKVETKRGQQAHSIGDILALTVDEAVDFLTRFPDSRPALRAVRSLRLLQEVGIGYLQLGQPINTLSGGESQRLKLVRYLAESDISAHPSPSSAPDHNISPDPRNPSPSPSQEERAGERRPARNNRANQPTAPDSVPPTRSTLFLFDEPTTGLHFDDVRVLLNVFQRLVDAGHSLVVIEHNLDLIKAADWIIDLGPEAGDLGGQLVVEGTPEEVAACPDSHTGRALKDALNPPGNGSTPTRLSSPRRPRRTANPQKD
jgi:excinuclease ABC subunit A